MKHPSRSDKVTVIQPYVPAYRVPLFDTLHELLAQDDLALQVAHPGPPPDYALRNDSSSGPWSVPINSRSARFGRKTLHLRNTEQFLAGSALVIAELASTNLDTYRLLAQNHTPVALWGHGKAYVTASNRVDTWLEARLCKRAVHAIVYTESGAQHLERQGIPREKITVAWNTTDTDSLRTTANALSKDEINRFRAEHALIGAQTALFVGALDESKRLDLLLDAVPIIQATIPEFRLVIAGEGPLHRVVSERAASNAAIRVVSYADPHTLALLGKSATLCLIPGRVGLAAVDAMTLGLPIVTTDWQYHAPEHDYLLPAFSVAARQDPAAFAAAVISLFSHEDRRIAMSVAAEAESHRYSIRKMAGNMHRAILAALG